MLATRLLLRQRTLSLHRSVVVLSCLVRCVSYRAASASSADDRLRALLRDADANPRDANRQALLYRALNDRGLYSAVVNRWEQQSHARNRDVDADYWRARTSLETPAPTQYDHAAQQTPMTTTPRYSANNPLYVAVTTSSPSRLLTFWRLGAACALVFASYYIVTASAPSLLSRLDSAFGHEFAAVTQPPNVKFSDVVGCDEAKADLVDVVEFLRHPATFNRLGGKMPKGVLLLGPPGTGKTLLAKAVAGEANVPFFSCSGSEFEEVFVGVGARRIRELFAAAKKRAPAIIFLDEIDAVGSRRHPKDVSAARMSLNQLLVELDGFTETSGVIVIAATNFPKLLDPALIRPGRFDRHVEVPVPDLVGRKQILDLYAKKVKMESGADMAVLARGTPGLTGAELAEIINAAALRAAAKGRQAVTVRDLEYAKDKVLMGAERLNAVRSDEARKLTAYHEGGHALVALHTTGAMPLHKATITPRGQSLGTTHFLPEDDLNSFTRTQLLAQLDVCMGGRVAEEMIFGADHVTTGASNDLEKATSIAQSMVCSYGMGESTGLISVDREHLQSVSTDLKAQINDEVKTIMAASYQRAKAVLQSNSEQLHRLATALLKYETLDGAEIKDVLLGIDINKDISY